MKSSVVQKDDTTIFGYVSEGNKQENRGDIAAFVERCEEKLLWFEQSSSQDLLRHHGGLSSILCHCVLGRVSTERDRKRLNKLVKRT